MFKHFQHGTLAGIVTASWESNLTRATQLDCFTAFEQTKWHWHVTWRSWHVGSGYAPTFVASYLSGNYWHVTRQSWDLGTLRLVIIIASSCWSVCLITEHCSIHRLSLALMPSKFQKGHHTSPCLSWNFFCIFCLFVAAYCLLRQLRELWKLHDVPCCAD